MITTARAARTYLAGYLALVIVFNVWAATPAATDLEFQGIWQIWHPYMLPFLALLVLPLCLGYNRRVIASFEGGGAVADGLRWLNWAVLSWAILGAGAYGGYLTCGAWPLWQCDNPLGTAPLQSLADIGTGLLFFPTFALALSHLSRLVGVTSGVVWRAWWVFALLLAFNLWIAAPPGLARTIPEWGASKQVVIALGFVLGNVVISGWAFIILVRARQAAGGMFSPLVVTVLIAAILSMVNSYLFTGVDSDLASDLSITLWGVMVLSMLYAFTIAGAITERMRAITDSI